MSRHRWTHSDAYHARCINCGTRALKRPHPYARRWFTEWRLPNGTTVDNFDGQPAPPCPPSEGVSGQPDRSA